jgi:hypothetical protein
MDNIDRLVETVATQAKTIERLTAGNAPAAQLHPLHTPEWVNEMLRYGMCEYEVTARRTGKSTAQALRGLGWVIDNPGRVLRVIDHAGTRASNDYLLCMMSNMAESLGLKHIVFNRANQTAVFKRTEGC